MAEKKVMSFEESLEKLEEIVKKLETGEVPLDEAITKLVKDTGEVVDFKVED